MPSSAQTTVADIIEPLKSVYQGDRNFIEKNALQWVAQIIEFFERNVRTRYTHGYHYIEKTDPVVPNDDTAYARYAIPVELIEAWARHMEIWEETTIPDGEDEGRAPNNLAKDNSLKCVFVQPDDFADRFYGTGRFVNSVERVSGRAGDENGGWWSVRGNDILVAHLTDACGIVLGSHFSSPRLQQADESNYMTIHFGHFAQRAGNLFGTQFGAGQGGNAVNAPKNVQGTHPRTHLAGRSAWRCHCA